MSQKKREAKPKGLTSRGGWGLLPTTQHGILVFRAWVSQQTGLEPVPRMSHLYHGRGTGVNLNCEGGKAGQATRRLRYQWHPDGRQRNGPRLQRLLGAWAPELL